MASTGPSGICTVLRGAGAGALGRTGALGVAAGATVAIADAEASAAGWLFGFDLQLHAEATKAKPSINRAGHERMKPPRANQ